MKVLKLIFLLFLIGSFCTLGAQKPSELSLVNSNILLQISEDWTHNVVNDQDIFSVINTDICIWIKKEGIVEADVVDHFEKGIPLSDGTVLMINSPIEQLSTEMLGAEFGGLLNWKASKSYVITLLSPDQEVIKIIVASDTSKYSEMNKEIALEFAAAIKFVKNAVATKR